MPEQPHTKILTRPRPDGTVEISVHDGQKEMRTGLAVPPGQVDAHCQNVAHTLKKAGNRVSHREVDR